MKTGVKLLVGSEEQQFNVVVFVVADLGFLKDVLGHASSTATFGCLHCDCPQQSWSNSSAPKGNPKTVVGMASRGLKALSELGKHPSKETKEYKNFIRNNYGQWVLFQIPPILVNPTPTIPWHYRRKF